MSDTRAAEAFIQPKAQPCDPKGCAEYNTYGQCPECGCLKPLPGDVEKSLREMPQGPSQPCLLPHPGNPPIPCNPPYPRNA